MKTFKEIKVKKSELLEIVAQASSLSERLNKKLFKVEETQDVEQQNVDRRLDRWCQIVAQGDWQKFHKRLEWDGLNIDEVCPLLGTVRLVDEKAFPDWAKTLEKIIQTAAEISLEDRSITSIDSENPLPFEDVLIVAILVARQKLLTRLNSPSLSSNYLPLELISQSAYLSLERDLLQRLINISGKTLNYEFCLSRSFGSNLLNLMIGETKDTPKRSEYNTFVQKLLQDGLLSFFQKYPVLGRLIATRINFWVEATAEFLQRLKTDRSQIQQFLFLQKLEDRVLGKVTAIDPCLSDPHHQGRSVIALTYESGLKLVYKPKDLGLEVAYGKFLDWCNQQDQLLPFKVLKVLNRQGYGWVEYVEQIPCEDKMAAQRFYQRAGMLLCLLYVLGGTDCHNENLIAHGEHLVPIDLETLLHHEANLMEPPETSLTENENQPFLDTVLRTGLLPRWDFSFDNRIAYDISGLGGIEGEQVVGRVPQWKSVNTDNMHIASETVKLLAQKNVPILQGKPLSLNDYLDEFVTGFRQMYGFLLQQRETLLAVDSPLEGLQKQRVRFIFRATQVYSAILHNSFLPEYLHHGSDRSIELDLLSRAFLWTEEKPKAWSILSAERQAMEQLDIPYFGATSDSDTLKVGLELPIEQYFKISSDNQAISRLQQLDETDLVRQVEIVQGAFSAKEAQLPTTDVSVSTADLSSVALLTSEELLEKALTIAEQIQSRAIKGNDGSLFWLGLGYVSPADRFQFQILGESLYDGSCGIALFLAALDYIQGRSQFRDLILKALRYLRNALQTYKTEDLARFSSFLGIGGATGLGSIIYSLGKIGYFLQDPAFLEDALRVANLITPELITFDRKLDLAAGAAGAILGLLALYQETAEPTVLNKAIACGQHLLKHQVSFDGLPKAWPIDRGKPLTGFSHGAAGIAYALLRLYQVTQDLAYLEAAKEGIAYERSVFSTTTANWPDFRSLARQNNRPNFMVSWCHGAPGIGLARLGCLSILETEEIHQDVEVALKTTQEYSVRDRDNICCGNFGRIEVLLVASQKLSRPQLEKAALKQAAWVMAKVERTGNYTLFDNLSNHVFNPGFFQGTAGIGYELLRLAYPEKLPSVLLWE